MNNFSAALKIIVAIGFAIAIGIGIAFAIISSAAYANPLVQEMEPPLPKPKPFVFDQCSPLLTFVNAMKSYGGRLAMSGEIPNRTISVIAFPDFSFGVFILNPETGIVCLIDTGWFVQPGFNT